MHHLEQEVTCSSLLRRCTTINPRCHSQGVPSALFKFMCCLQEHADETGMWCQAGSKLSAAEAQAKVAAWMQWKAGMERKSRLVASGGTGLDRLAQPAFVDAVQASAATESAS